MKKLFLLLLAGFSLHAMENDNNNNVSHQALIEENATDYFGKASYFVIHDHQEKKPMFGSKHCWKYRVEKEKIKITECPEFGNTALKNKLVTTFYDRQDDIVQEIDFGMKKKEIIVKLARLKLDPNARPQACWGIFWDMGLPKITLYDQNYNVLAEPETFDVTPSDVDTDVKLSQAARDGFAKIVDASSLYVFYSNSKRAKDILQKIDQEKKAEKALKKEKK